MYLMPDGRPLSAYLTNTNNDAGAPRRMAPKGKKNQKKKGSASFAGRRSAPALALFASQLDEQELNSLNKLGQRKQRRCTNDLLLRAMAPEMSPDDIDGLFKPVPFGDAHPPSAFSLVEGDEGTQELWRNCLLSVGMDKQERILEKWRAYVRELNSVEDEYKVRDDEDDERKEKRVRQATVAAYRRRWQASLSSSGRSAVKSVSDDVVREIEAKVLPCLLGVADEVELRSEDGYGRLLAHSLAKFHGLSSQTRRDKNGEKYVSVRRRDAARPGELFIALCDWLSTLGGSKNLSFLL